MATATMTAKPDRAIAEAITHHASRITLAIIILIEVAFGILYAYRTPRWQAPDEPAHYNYVAHIATTATLPKLNPGDYDQNYLEQIKSRKFPADMSVDSIRYENYQPPLYYLIAAPVYLFAQGIGIEQVVALRLLSVLLGAVTLGLAYLVFKQLWPSNRFLVLTAVGLMAVIPMNIAMWAAVNADPLADLLIALLLLICLARLRGKLNDRTFILTGGLVYGLVLLTSIKIYPAGALLVLAEFGRWWRRRTTDDSTGTYFGRGRRTTHHASRITHHASRFTLYVSRFTLYALHILVPLFLVALVISSWWFIRNALVYGGLDVMGLAQHDRVVVGQPTTADWITQYGFKSVFADFFIITFKSFWAQFGWMGVLVNDRIYVSLFVLTAAALFGALLWMVRLARERGAELRDNEWSWAILGAWLVTVLLAHVWYNIHYVQPQGRYLFPALIPISVVLVIGLNELLDKRYSKLVLSVLYFALIILDYLSLAWYIVPQLRG